MFIRIWAGILSLLSFFTMNSNPQGQPNSIPETRVSPYGDAVPDKYGVWPTEAFAEGQTWWITPAAAEAYAHAFADKLGDQESSDSLLVLHRGRVVYEHYSDGYGAETRFNTYSVTKSVVSALVGIAIGEGAIEGAHQKVVDFFPGAGDLPDWEEAKADMTIEHLLTMTSGIVCTEELWGAFCGPGVADSALAAFMLPQAHAPGTRFAYDSAAPSILLGIIERATGRAILDYAGEKLFGPLGMASVEWETAPDGLPFGGLGIHMTARDMARFGYLYLNFGRWEDEQIIPADWVAQTPPRVRQPHAYGRMFWRNHLAPFGSSYCARGHRGQYVVVMPALDIVLVRTSWVD